jgi:hypothetical protein
VTEVPVNNDVGPQRSPFDSSCATTGTSVDASSCIQERGFHNYVTLWTVMAKGAYLEHETREIHR